MLHLHKQKVPINISLLATFTIWNLFLDFYCYFSLFGFIFDFLSRKLLFKCKVGRNGRLEGGHVTIVTCCICFAFVGLFGPEQSESSQQNIVVLYIDSGAFSSKKK